MTTVSAETDIAPRPDPPLADARAAAAVDGAGRFRWGGLVWTLIRTDFKVRYHGTWGGFVWALLKPLTMFVMLMAVFSFLFAADPTYKFDLIIGLFLWDFFAEGTKAGLVSLDAKRFLLTKARCPSWIIVVSSIANAGITLTVFIVIIVAFLAAVGHAPAPVAVAWFLGYAAMLVLIVIALSLASSVMFLRYRDLNQVWDLMIQVGFFVAPIIYPIAILPERFHRYVYLWPPTPVVEFARAALVRGVLPTLRADAMLAGAVAVSLATGAWIFRRLAPRAAEYL
jgi:lipopolysaccharide transport system permease protein